MTARTRDQLESYFKTGEVPTEQHFADLIESSLNQVDDGVRVDMAGRLGVGTATPTAALDLRGRLSTPLAGTVTVAEAAKKVVGAGTAFDAELHAGATLRIVTPTARHDVTVATVDGPAALTLSAPFPDGSAAQGGCRALRDGALVHVADSRGNARLVLDERGRIGVGRKAPAAALDVDGEVKATAFVGSGAKLSDVRIATAAQLPAIPVAKLEGQIPASKISGLPKPAPAAAAEALRLDADPPCLDVRPGPGAVDLCWQAPGDLTVVLQYIHEAAIVSLSTAKHELDEQTHRHRVRVGRDTTFTLSAFRDETLVGQRQVRVSVIPRPVTPVVTVTPEHVAARLMAAHKDAHTAVAVLAKRFGLGPATPGHVHILATALKRAGYPDGDIFQFVPGFYEEGGEPFTAAAMEALYHAIEG